MRCVRVPLPLNASSGVSSVFESLQSCVKQVTLSLESIKFSFTKTSFDFKKVFFDLCFRYGAKAFGFR